MPMSKTCRRRPSVPCSLDGLKDQLSRAGSDDVYAHAPRQSVLGLMSWALHILAPHSWLIVSQELRCQLMCILTCSVILRLAILRKIVSRSEGFRNRFNHSRGFSKHSQKHPKMLSGHFLLRAVVTLSLVLKDSEISKFLKTWRISGFSDFRICMCHPRANAVFLSACNVFVAPGSYLSIFQISQC